MSSKATMMKSIVMTLALAAIPGIASADDSSTNPFAGKSYAAFNGGNVGRTTKPLVFDRAPSVWRQVNPAGLSERELQALSSPGPAWESSPEPAPSWVATKKSRILNDSVARGIADATTSVLPHSRRAIDWL